MPKRGAGWRCACVLAIGAFATSSCGGGAGDATSTTPAPPPPPSPATPTGPHIARIEILSGGRDDLSQPHELGGRIEVEIQFRGEGLVVEGSPSLTIEIGDNTRVAALTKVDSRPNEGFSYLRFRYNIAAGDHDPDGVSIREGALSLNGGSIQDVAGNDADLTLGSLAIENDPHHVVDAGTVPPPSPATPTGPHITRIEISGGGRDGLSQPHELGGRIDVEIQFRAEGLVVEGSPSLTIEIGDDIRVAALTKVDSRPNQGFSYLRFRYKVTAGDHDPDGISIREGALSLNGGSIKDVNGNDADLTIGDHAIDNDPHQIVMAIVGVERVSFTGGPDDHNVGYLPGERIGVEVFWNSRLAVKGYPTLGIEVGDSLRTARMDFVENRDGGAYIRFYYRVRADDEDPDGVSIPPDAIQLPEGASILSLETGEPVSVDLQEHAVVDDALHRCGQSMMCRTIRFVLSW